MTNSALTKALDDIYASLHNNNENLDTHIASLKGAVVALGAASVEMDPSKLPQPNRQGRKLLQSYFRKRGVVVTFPDAKTS